MATKPITPASVSTTAVGGDVRLGRVGTQERVTRLGRVRTQVLDSPLELVVADHANVYVEVGRSREVASVRKDGRPYLAEPVHSPPQPLAARKRTVGRRQRYLGATEVVGGDDPYCRDLAHQFTLPGLSATPRVYESVRGLTTTFTAEGAF